MKSRNRGRLASAVIALLLPAMLFIAHSPSTFAATQGVEVEQLEVCPTCALSSLAEAIERAPASAEITVRGGEYPGGLLIEKSLTLIGVDNPVVDGGGQGTLISAVGANLAVSGFTLRATGSNHDREDAAIVIEGGRATIVDNRIEDALFGVYLKNAAGSTIRGNKIAGKSVDIAMRGDGIKVWYSDDVTIERNQASGGRDIILWNSNRGIVRHNVFDRERYGLHLMFSHDATIESNSLRANSIGLFIMYSRNILVRGNSLSDNHGPSGGGLGLKDVDQIVVEGNRFIENQVGAQIDSSPTAPGVENMWLNNVFAFNQTAVAIMPSVRHNTFSGNSFVDNAEHVATTGRGELKEISWALAGIGNYWSDYAGFDADGDGIGDIPYRSDRLFESLMDEHPSLKLFLFSPSASAVDFAAKAFPGVRPEQKLSDPHPLMSPRVSSYLPPLESMSTGSRSVTGGIGLAAILAGIASLAWIRSSSDGSLRSRQPKGTEATL
jgi:nitrous oxidase accessory protein